MSFEQTIRDRIAKSTPVVRNVLKVVLGEYQQKNFDGRATEQTGLNIIEKLIKANDDTLGYLKSEDGRIATLREENEALVSLLPKYLTCEQICKKIAGDESLYKSVMECGNSGRTVGMVVKWCKTNNLEVKGEVVREAVQKILTHPGR